MILGLFLYLPVVWAALLLAQCWGGSLLELIGKLSVAIQHPAHIAWTERSPPVLLVCTGLYVFGILLYIGIIDSSKNLWELVLELKKDQCHKGYGTRANILFIRKIAEITGKTQYKSVVEVDNLASQACMAKLNAELVDIENRAFKSEEEAEQFEEEHLDLINDHMIQLASELDVEPRQLLSHVLDYRIYADRLPDIAWI